MTVAGKLILKSGGNWTELDREMNDIKHLAPHTIKAEDQAIFIFEKIRIELT